jgi:hypothetical protein
VIAFVGMGSGHDVFDAVGHGHEAHFLGHVPGLGPVVHVGKDVAMDVNHEANFRGKALMEFKQILGERPRG